MLQYYVIIHHHWQKSLLCHSLTWMYEWMYKGWAFSALAPHLQWSIVLTTHGAEPFWRSRQFCSYSRISQHFMKPEGSLPCSQESSTGPYPSLENSARFYLNSATFTFLQRKVVSLAPNPQPWEPGLCIYVPQWQGGPVISPSTDFHFRLFCYCQWCGGGSLTRLHTRCFVIIIVHKNNIYLLHVRSAVKMLNALKKVCMEMITNCRKATMYITKTCKKR
jgi:hypothetical protein